MHTIPDLCAQDKFSITRLSYNYSSIPQHMMPANTHNIDDIKRVMGIGYGYVGMNASKLIGHKSQFYTA
eukprot:15171527-Ditylum_brightwellii.AAC.1